MGAQSDGHNVDGQNAPGIQQEVITWLQQNALPLQHIEAGNGFSDLQPLQQMLKDVQVVGLGETTHGTREFFQFKHRLVEYLVTELNFAAFAIESSFATCHAINEYILHGKGDRAAALTEQWYVPWDTEEVSALLDWLRAHNQGVAAEKKVRFYGIDLTRNEKGRQAILAYLRQVAPERVAATANFFKTLAQEEGKWPLRIDDECKDALAHLMPQLQEVIDHLTANKERFVNSTSEQEYELVLHYARIMQQFIITYAPALWPPSQDRDTLRSAAMAENLIWLADRAKIGAKFIVWAHNWHVHAADPSLEKSTTGACLRQRFGQGYFAIGFEFNQGSFLTRKVLPEKVFGDLKEVALPPAPMPSLPWYLAQTHLDMFLLNLRLPPPNPTVAQWLATRQPFHDVSWGFNEEARDYLEPYSLLEYDGLIFIAQISASRPTASAMQTVMKREAL
jgi:erythromycin esterase